MVTPAPVPSDARRPNILLVVADQERQRGWIPPDLTLPHRQRLLDDGLEFTRFYTHSSPCSPSRATILTGRTVPEHGVVDNVVFPGQRELDPGDPDDRATPARRRLPHLLHRQVAPLPRGVARPRGVRLLRLVRQRPSLHGLGRHGRRVRPLDRRAGRHLARGERRQPQALAPRRRAGQPPRRDVVPDRPARLPARPRRRGRRGEALPRGRGMEGDRSAPRIRRAVRRGVRHPPAQLRRRPVHEAGRAARVALPAAAHPLRVPRPGRHPRLVSPPRLLLAAPPGRRPQPRARARRARRVGRPPPRPP